LTDNARLRVAPGEKVNFVIPSVDVTMQSVRPPWPGQRLFGVILTGMGRDGAAGLAHLKRLGAATFAQDKATCAVHGMPAEAVRMGAVDSELPPEGIVQRLMEEILGGQKKVPTAASGFSRITP
jgi:two-component system chemotaxis response regulator CheB